MQRNYSWPNNARNVIKLLVYTTIVPETGQHLSTGTIYIFPETRLLEVLATDTLGRLPKTTKGNHRIIIIASRHWKLTRAMPTARSTTATVASIFSVEWVIPFGIPSFLFNDNGLQLGSIFWHIVYLYQNRAHGKDCLLQTGQLPSRAQ